MTEEIKQWERQLAEGYYNTCKISELKSLSKTDPFASSILADKYSAENEWENAIPYYKNAIKIFEDNKMWQQATSTEGLSVAYVKLGRGEDAVNVLQNCIEAEISEGFLKGVYNNLAAIYENGYAGIKRNPDKAEYYLKKSVKSAQDCYKVALYLNQRGKRLDAIEMLENASDYADYKTDEELKNRIENILKNETWPVEKEIPEENANNNAAQASDDLADSNVGTPEMDGNGNFLCYWVKTVGDEMVSEDGSSGSFWVIPKPAFNPSTNKIEETIFYTDEEGYQHQTFISTRAEQIDIIWKELKARINNK